MHGRFPVAVQANFRITAYFINLKRLKKNDKIKKDCKSTRKGRRAIFFFKMRLFHLLFPKEEAIIVFASMSSEQTCLQGFASDDIHKALAFLIKNAENESFNA